jgi:hypothetical protein
MLDRPTIAPRGSRIAALIAERMLPVGLFDAALGAIFDRGNSFGRCDAPGCRRRGIYRKVVGWHVEMFGKKYNPNDAIVLCRRHRRPVATPYNP